MLSARSKIVDLCNLAFPLKIVNPLSAKRAKIDGACGPLNYFWIDFLGGICHFLPPSMSKKLRHFNIFGRFLTRNLAQILKYFTEELGQHVRWGVLSTRQNQSFQESLPEVRYLFSFKNEA